MFFERTHGISKWLHFFVCFWRDSPPVGQGLLIHEVSRSHSTTHHSRQDSSGRVISSSQRPLPDNTHNRLPCPRWDSNPQSQQAADLRIRPPGHWERQIVALHTSFLCTICINLNSLAPARNKDVCPLLVPVSILLAAARLSE
jgi:hypothetical protein